MKVIKKDSDSPAVAIMQSVLGLNEPSWRYGQSIYNQAQVLYPIAANNLKMTDVDCFHDDSKTSAFFSCS